MVLIQLRNDKYWPDLEGDTCPACDNGGKSVVMGIKTW